MSHPVAEWVSKAEGDFAEKDEAIAAYRAVKVVREFIRQKLGLS
jgi:hypothetical protein